MMKSKHILCILLLPTLFLLICIVVFPLLYSLYFSFSNLNLIYPHRSLKFGIFNYTQAILSDTRFLHSLKVTFALTGMCLGLQFCLGLGIALLFTQKIKGKELFLILLILPMTTMPAVVGLIWKILYNQEFGLLNYFLEILGIGSKAWLTDPLLVQFAVVGMNTWQWTPFIFLVLYVAITAIPPDLLEAAMIDGTTRWQKFIFIIIPLIKPAIAIVLLFRMVDLLRIFDAVYSLTSGGPGTATETISIYIYLHSFRFFSIGYGGSLSWLFLIFVTVIVTIYLKIFPITAE